MLINEGDLSVAKACNVVGLSRGAWYKEDPVMSQLERDVRVIDELNRLVNKHPRWGVLEVLLCAQVSRSPLES